LVFRIDKPGLSNVISYSFEKPSLSTNKPGFSIEKPGLSKKLIIKFDKPGFSNR